VEQGRLTREEEEQKDEEMTPRRPSTVLTFLYSFDSFEESGGPGPC